MASFGLENTEPGGIIIFAEVIGVMTTTHFRLVTEIGLVIGSS